MAEGQKGGPSESFKKDTKGEAITDISTSLNTTDPDFNRSNLNNPNTTIQYSENIPENFKVTSPDGKNLVMYRSLEEPLENEQLKKYIQDEISRRTNLNMAGKQKISMNDSKEVLNNIVIGGISEEELQKISAMPLINAKGILDMMNIRDQLIIDKFKEGKISVKQIALFLKKWPPTAFTELEEMK